MNKFAAFVERLEAKSVLLSKGLCILDLLIRGSVTGPRWGHRLQIPFIYRASHLYYVGLQLSSAGTAKSQKN